MLFLRRGSGPCSGDQQPIQFAEKFQPGREQPFRQGCAYRAFGCFHQLVEELQVLAVVEEIEELFVLSGTEEIRPRSEEHTSELQSPCNLVCRLLLEKKKVRLAHRGDEGPQFREIL